MIPVEKYHGTGNDFVVVDADADVRDRRAFARHHCDRDSGISHPASPRTGVDGVSGSGGSSARGADGVLFLGIEGERTPPRVAMTLVQSDGSTAAMCGNGARCAAAWAADRTGTDAVVVDTPAGTRRADLTDDGVRVEMGRPRFDPDAVPVDRETPLVEAEVAGLEVTAVGTGVPHAVAFVDDVRAVDLAAVAPPVRHADVFPEGANVTLAAERPGGYDQRTYERGVEAETDACGTGAVAVAAVAHELGRVATGQTVTVSPPGGDLAVTVTDEGSVLEGPVEREFATQVADPDGR